MLFIVFVSVLLLHISAVHGADCRAGFERGANTDKCYFAIGVAHSGNDLSRFLADFREAYSWCHTFGAGLATVNSVDEHNAVKKLMNETADSHDHVWVNGNMISQPTDKQTIYKSDGQKNVWLDQWATGQPDTANAQKHCLTVLHAEGYKLALEDCTVKHPFVCEQEDNKIY